MIKSEIKRLKHFARRGLGRSGFTGGLLKDTVSVFVYHEVSETPSAFCEQYNLNIIPKLFARQMDFIRESFNVITPDQLLEGNYETPAALITFDDGMPGYFREAVTIMTKRGIPSIIFLNMAPVEGEIFWSALITYLTEYDAEFCKLLHNRFPQQGNIPDFLLCNRQIVNDYLAAIDSPSLESKVRSFYGPFAGVKDLDAVQGNPLVFFGNHFHNHYNAAQLSDEESREQYLLNDQKILKYKNARPLFAYPFGQPGTCFTGRHTELLHSLGAKAVFSSGGRINKRGQDGFYDRIGIDSSIETIDDLLGLIQWMQLKTGPLKASKLPNCLSTGVPQTIRSNGFLKQIYPAPSDSIPYGRQSIDDEDIAAVVDVLKSGPITQGPKIQEFESALCRVTGAPFAVAVNSGTAALHIACLAAGIGPGDEVVTSPITFVASANCAAYCGARPVFADINPRTYNMSVQEIEKKINERTKAVIAVHFAGQSCDMAAIQGIVKASELKYGHKIYIIEDACHALGSSYKGKPIGSGTHSDMTILSFHPVKHITTGEGGAVLANDKTLQRKLLCLRTHGITNDIEEFSDKENGFEKVSGQEPTRRKWYYEQNLLGYHYRITDIQCALGISQLKKLPQFSKRRREIVNQYNAAFKNIEWLTMPHEESFSGGNFHLYVLQFDFEKIGKCRAQVMAELAQKKVLTQVHYIPVHTQPFYRKNFGTNWGDCPQAERYYQKCLSIPLFPAMSDEDVRDVVNAIKGLA